jgi:hypothetical protein
MAQRITFQVVSHARKPGVKIVEILADGQMCATIYPDETQRLGIKLVSAHFAGELTHNDEFPTGVTMQTGEDELPPIPAIFIQFDPRPYDVGARGIERIPTH